MIALKSYPNWPYHDIDAERSHSDLKSQLEEDWFVVVVVAVAVVVVAVVVVVVVVAVVVAVVVVAATGLCKQSSCGNQQLQK